MPSLPGMSIRRSARKTLPTAASAAPPIAASSHSERGSDGSRRRTSITVATMVVG